MTGPDPVSIEEPARLIARGTGRGVRIAIIDSGVELPHPRLEGLKLADDVAIVSDGVKLVARPNDGQDAYGHGTAVASIVRESAPDADLGSFRVFDGRNSSRSSIVREAVHQALDRGYQVINCSFGCGLPDQVLSYKEWVDEAYLRGVHVVAACNNIDFNTPEWPGHFTSVITVNMARTPDASRIWYKRGNLVEFAACGVQVDVPWLGGQTRNMTGSSFAAPRVAGLVARLLSAQPGLSPIEMKLLLYRLAEPWTFSVFAPNVA